MRRLRRFAVALLGVLLIPLTPLGAAAECGAPAGKPTAGAGHGGSGVLAAAASHVGAAHDHDGHAQHAPRPARDVPRPGHEPGPAHHGGDVPCPASTSCANVAAVDGTPDLITPGAPAAGGVTSVDGWRPASVVLPPEPPPPRARGA